MNKKSADESDNGKFLFESLKNPKRTYETKIVGDYLSGKMNFAKT